MGNVGDGGSTSNSDNRSHFPPLIRQNSLYTLTLDEVQNQLGEMGKPLSSMNFDELLRSVSMEFDGFPLDNQIDVQNQPDTLLSSALSKKTVDEVWRNIQQNENHCENENITMERQQTLGEMTLEDFLVKAGVVAEPSLSRKNDNIVAGGELSVAPHYVQQGQWLQYPQPLQYQHPQQKMMLGGVYAPSEPNRQSIHMGRGALLDLPFSETLMPLSPPLMGVVPELFAPPRKRGIPDDLADKCAERRRRRMIKNRESAARSRARKQAYTHELEAKVSSLEEKNDLLRKYKELEDSVACISESKPRYQLRRTSST